MTCVATFYKFARVAQPASLKRELFECASGLHLKGTVLIANEGINGTLTGAPDSLDSFIARLQARREFADIRCRHSFAAQANPVFHRLKVRVKSEIVNFGDPAIGERTLWIDCDVLQADGGTRCASITGAYVAVALAVRRLLRREALSRDPLRDSVAAVSTGVVDGSVVLDLAYEEDSRAEVDMNVVATSAGRFVEVQDTGEGVTFSEQELASLTCVALGGIAALTDLQRRAIEAGEPG